MRFETLAIIARLLEDEEKNLYTYLESARKRRTEKEIALDELQENPNDELYQAALAAAKEAHETYRVIYKEHSAVQEAREEFLYHKFG